MRRVLLPLLMAASAAWAHHSMAAMYDESKTITIQGTVTKYDWANPHVLLLVDDARGSWMIEFPSRVVLKRASVATGATRQQGWTADSFQLGDEVSILAHPALDGSLRADGMQVTKPAGAVFSIAPSVPLNTRVGPPSKTIPRGPDGHPLLGAPAGAVGYWLARVPVLAEQTASATPTGAGPGIPVSVGGKQGTADLSTVAPLQPWALALYQYRQANKFKDDPMASCLPPGGPRQFQDPFGVRFLEQPERQRIFVMSQGANRNWRMIHMDGRALPNGDDVTPTYYGYSVGHWDRDTLVVESTGYIERFWFVNGGLPHTESLHLTERFTRQDAGTLLYEVTVDDPGAYTRPWTARMTLEWIDSDFQDEYFCDDYNREELP